MLSWGTLWQLNELKWFCSWRESNEKLLNSAFDMERERKYMVWNHGETTKTSKLWSFQGNRECAEGSDFSAWDNIEVGSERQKPSDWGSCKGEGGFCSDGVGFPGFFPKNWPSNIPRALYIQDLQSKFLAMKEDAEKQEDKLRYFAKVGSVEKRETATKKTKKITTQDN